MPWHVNEEKKTCYWEEEEFWVVAVPVKARKPSAPLGFHEVNTEAGLQLGDAEKPELLIIRRPGTKGAWKLNRAKLLAYWNDENKLRQNKPRLLAKRPIYPPWGYREVAKPAADDPNIGQWRVLGETAPGLSDLCWARRPASPTSTRGRSS